MKHFASLGTAIALLLAVLVLSASAEVVGRLTQVEGRVDFLKGGKLPAVEAKLENPVEVGDVLRTKSLSKAQITFVDQTVLTISPESRIAIDDYMFDPAKGKRNAVLQLFQGMALAVVSKIFKVQEPDFVLKTHTAVMGVRGTEVGVRLGPNDSTFMNFKGLTRVANIFPEVAAGGLLPHAAKVAFSFGNKGYVDLGDMQGTTVARGLPPTLPFKLTDEDRQMFMRQMSVQVLSQRGGKDKSGTASQQGKGSSGSSSSASSNSSASDSATSDTGGGGSSGSTSSITSSSASSGTGLSASTVTLSSTGTITTVASQVVSTGLTTTASLTPSQTVITTTIAPLVPPPVEVVVTPPTPVATFVNLAFSQVWTGPGSMVVNTQPTATFFSTGPGSGTFNITSYAPGSATISLFPNGFTLSNFSFQATITTPNTYWSSAGWNGTFNTSATGNLTGDVNGTLSGLVNMIVIIPNDLTFRLNGPVTYYNGIMNYNFNYDAQQPTQNTFAFRGGRPQGIITTGTWTQIKR